jgi:hypothetical protein
MSALNFQQNIKRKKESETLSANLLQLNTTDNPKKW